MTGFAAPTPPEPHLLLTSAAIRAIEEKHLAAGANLMERAGLAAASAARGMLRTAPNHPARVLVLAGPGNNGGDAFEVAVHLRQAGFDVSVWFAGDAPSLPRDAQAAHAKWIATGGTCSSTLPAPEQFDLIIDGLFGIGLKRALGAPFSDIVERVNHAATHKAVPVLALDLPSGLDADTGSLMGIAIRATRTLTFIADKPGMHTLHGPDYAGAVEIASLDLRIDAAADAGRLTSRIDFASLLTPRLRNTHKGSNGTLGIFGGARGMTGAALLAGRAALKLGAGKVFIGLQDGDGFTCDPLQPELMLRDASALLQENLTAAVIGPGLGSSAAAHQLLAATLALPIAILLDADALNLISADAALGKLSRERTAVTIMTPHPLEAARLLGVSTAEVQSDRIAAIQKIAQRYSASVVLKGAGSIVASPNGTWWINPTGNPGMASAGMGDVLAGLAGAFFAQHHAAKTLGISHSSVDETIQPLVGAVFLHGAAADALVARGIGPVGLTASDVIDEARVLWNAWSAQLP
jgi:ADP-dependent NAD(P)H-hydrate dehydratase / NAD(P)H-hydrate epimerase